ncbi:MAG: hypothetical protein LBF37_00395 [Rickettsiales bacterium]|jgi:tRNA nucleotidyltransferase (CCA-adding enzyme)|nr:hypothetical protein [Rickettsiales bacterium]
MKIYQVGGAIRNQIIKKELGITLPVTDNDFVVTGATVREMLDLGFHQVGKDFPVFLHPETRDEYALARREIKTGQNHTSFEFIFSENTLIEDDLFRRDFTMNAIAFIDDTYIDPYHGIQDIKTRTIRHVSDEHFPEDPLRVLRACRFAAQLNFDIADETMTILKRMVADGELKHLSKERIMAEIKKALSPGYNSRKFIEYMSECGALKEILPDIENLKRLIEKPEHHGEGNAFEHTLMVLDQAINESFYVKMGCLFHDVGKYIAQQRNQKGHDSYEIALRTGTLLKRLKFDNKVIKTVRLTIMNHMRLKFLDVMTQKKIHDILSSISSGFRDISALIDQLIIFRCDNNGRISDAIDADHDQIIFDKWIQIFNICKNIQFKDLKNTEKLQPVERKDYLRKVRIAAIKKYIDNP